MEDQFILYWLEDTRFVKKVGQFSAPTYKTEGQAKAARTRWIKKHPSADGKIGIAEKHYFHENIEKKVERTNLMSGKKYMEPINTPACCSPASETYWSL